MCACFAVISYSRRLVRAVRQLLFFPQSSRQVAVRSTLRTPLFVSVCLGHGAGAVLHTKARSPQQSHDSPLHNAVANTEGI